MKKILIVAAATGLMSLAACGGNTETANNTAENVAAALEETADNIELLADNATNEVAAELDDAANAVDAVAANVAE